MGIHTNIQHRVFIRPPTQPQVLSKAPPLLSFSPIALPCFEVDSFNAGRHSIDGDPHACTPRSARSIWCSRWVDWGRHRSISIDGVAPATQQAQAPLKQSLSANNIQCTSLRPACCLPPLYVLPPSSRIHMPLSRALFFLGRRSRAFFLGDVRPRAGSPRAPFQGPFDPAQTPHRPGAPLWGVPDPFPWLVDVHMSRSHAR